MSEIAELAPGDASALLTEARRITIKVGSSLLIGDSGSSVRRGWLEGLACDIAAMRQDGQDVVIVSSGAVALGRQHLGLRPSSRLAVKQAAAAAGQALLMQAWERALAPYGIPTAQLLLTIDDSEQRRRWLNARATLDVLLGHGALPVVNENDSVATEELRYGDNDRLSARVAQMTRSDLLILLSDVDGLYSADPAREPNAVHIPYLAQIDRVAQAYAGGPLAHGVGTGGMRTKLEAAAIAQAFGCATMIASGREDRPVTRLLEGARATVIPAKGSPQSAYKQWIAATLAPAGSVSIDEGAARALASGSSLLPAGVTGVSGDFHRGVCLRILDPAGIEVARGLTAYTAEEARAIFGASSASIAERLGYRGPDELIHRDDLVLR